MLKALYIVLWINNGFIFFNQFYPHNDFINSKRCFDVNSNMLLSVSLLWMAIVF